MCTLLFHNLMPCLFLDYSNRKGQTVAYYKLAAYCDFVINSFHTVIEYILWKYQYYPFVYIHNS